MLQSGERTDEIFPRTTRKCLTQSEDRGRRSKQGTPLRQLSDSRVTIHMAASLDGFIARKDGSVDWLETPDEFAGGESMDSVSVESFLKTIDCYVMGARTYEMALDFEEKGFGWAYGDKPTFVLTHRELRRVRDT